MKTDYFLCFSPLDKLGLNGGLLDAETDGSAVSEKTPFNGNNRLRWRVRILPTSFLIW